MLPGLIFYRSVRPTGFCEFLSAEVLPYPEGTVSLWFSPISGSFSLHTSFQTDGSWVLRGLNSGAGMSIFFNSMALVS